MHKEVKQWINKVRIMYPQYFFNSKVLEVGSLNINGTPRDKFYFCEYTGVDLQEGKGVDVVCSGHEYLIHKYFDVVISTECLEHDKHWEETLRCMYDNLKSNGLMIMTCAAPEREEHGTTRTTPQYSPFTTDYYRNISMLDLISVFGIIPNYNSAADWCPINGKYFRIGEARYKRGMKDLCFWGIKKNKI